MVTCSELRSVLSRAWSLGKVIWRISCYPSSRSPLSTLLKWSNGKARANTAGSSNITGVGRTTGTAFGTPAPDILFDIILNFIQIQHEKKSRKEKSELWEQTWLCSDRAVHDCVQSCSGNSCDVAGTSCIGFYLSIGLFQRHGEEGFAAWVTVYPPYYFT